MTDTVKRVYLQPGDMCVAKEPAVISTVLGSCVSVIIHCKRLQVSAMCHAIMPSGRGKSDDGFQYVDSAVGYMLNVFQKLEAGDDELEIKLFGGADQLGRSEESSRNIGARNVETAKDILRRCGCFPKRSDTGGRLGRKIIYNTRTGEVLLKRLGA